MSNPSDLKYTQEHEWVRIQGTQALIGITDHAQKQLGDVVYVELPKVGATVKASASVGSVESTKAQSDVYSPLSGKVVRVNEALAKSPESINNDPYGEGWLFELELSDSKEVDGLMDATAYEKHTAEA